MSDTSGLPNTNSEGVPEEDEPERFEGRREGEGEAESAGDGAAAEPPPADFDPAQNPSNPDLVGDAEQPE
ncbi:hypothetical protein [Leifsonia poae]|uniref:hypothetical protein n=1 Tax=Leifsonia poae TaxID=110933 RepID=UPI003D664F2A